MSKRALLVGCNYPGTKAELKGCINDVFNMKAVLEQRFGFDPEDIVVMIDTNKSYPQPTGANIRNGLKKIIANTRPGDVLVLHYSGHGTQVPGETNHPDDTGVEECIVPTDMNLLTDDDFREVVNQVPPGVTFTFISDSCHSGGLIDHEKEQVGDVALGKPTGIAPNYSSRFERQPNPAYSDYPPPPSYYGPPPSPPPMGHHPHHRQTREDEEVSGRGDAFEREQYDPYGAPPPPPPYYGGPPPPPPYGGAPPPPFYGGPESGGYGASGYGYNPQGPSGYTPQGPSGYTPQGSSGYISQGAPGYPPQGPSNYTSQGQSGYTSQGPSGYPPHGQAGYTSQGQSGYPSQPSYEQSAPRHWKNKSLDLSTLLSLLSQRSGKKVDVGNIRPALYDMFQGDSSVMVQHFVGILMQNAPAIIEQVQGKGSASSGGIMGVLGHLAMEFIKGQMQGAQGGDHMAGLTPVAQQAAMAPDHKAAYAGSAQIPHFGNRVPDDMGILLSGCQANETSADADPSGDSKQAFGAFSNAIQTVLRKTNGPITNRQLVIECRKLLLQQGYSQHPCLYCGDSFVDAPFIC